MTKNRLYCGENIEILPTIEAESVDLIWMTKKSAFLPVFAKKDRITMVLIRLPR